MQQGTSTLCGSSTEVLAHLPPALEPFLQEQLPPPAAASGTVPALPTVFRLVHHCGFGERYGLLGSCEQLGAWDPASVVPLTVGGAAAVLVSHVCSPAGMVWSAQEGFNMVACAGCICYGSQEWLSGCKALAACHLAGQGHVPSYRKSCCQPLCKPVTCGSTAHLPPPPPPCSGQRAMCGLPLCRCHVARMCSTSLFC